MANQALVKFVNELGILTQLRTQGPASRAELARRLSLTPPSITRLVSSLQDSGLIRETEAKASVIGREPGRPAVTLEIDPSGAYFLGVEIGVDIIRFALIDLTTSAVDRAEIIVAKDITPTQAVALIAKHASKLQRKKSYLGRIRSVGVTVPGLVRNDGFVVYLPMLGWRNINLAELLSGAIGLPCRVENNADAAAFGAVYTQPNIPTDCTVFLKIGSGCGGAAIINGRLLRGAAGTAGELGHIPLTREGRKCSCGQTGCLESWVNLAAVAEDFLGGEANSSMDRSTLPERVAAAAQAQAPEGVYAAQVFTSHLALGVVALVNIFNPSTIMLGGIMLPLIDHCMPGLRDIVARSIVPGTLMPNIRTSPLGTYECAIGAAAVAHHQAFDISNVEVGSLEQQLVQ